MKRTFSMLLVTLLLVSMFTATFSIRAAGTGLSPLTVPDEPTTMQETINLASQEPPSTEWNKTYGGTDGENALALVQTVDGGYALTGYTTSFGVGSADAWLVKTDATGNMQWNRTYGGTSDDYASALVQTVDGGYTLACSTMSFGAGYYDFWLVKTDLAGNALWNKTYGGTSDDDAAALVQTVDGGYALAGSTMSFGAGGGDFWLVKTDSSGNALWNKTYGGTSTDGACALVQTVDGGYALAGWTDSFGAGSLDFWLVKTDSSGNAQWNRTYGGTNEDWTEALVQTVDGGYALAGYTYSYGAGSLDFWLVKTDSSGNAQWNRTYGGTGDDSTLTMVQTVDGGYALAGYTTSFGAGYYDSWLVKTDLAGNALWNKTYGGTNYDDAWALVQTVDGGYAIAGRTNSFGAGSSDFWLVKTAPDSWTGGTIYIRADGSIDPPIAPIFRDGDTYTFTDNVSDGAIVVERDNVVVDGAGYTVQGRTGDDYDIGIDLSYRSNITIKNTQIEEFGWSSIKLYSSSNNTISGNNITNNDLYNIGLWYSSNNIISGNSITANNKYGIRLYSSSNNLISGNNITNNGWEGIFLGSSSNNIVSGNNITNNENGIELHNYSSNNSIAGNNITNNGVGISFSTSSNNTISGNNITSNYAVGVYLTASSNSNVSGNNITNNSYGIGLSEFSSNNTVSGNNITNNAEFGVRLSQSPSNVFRNNNIAVNRYNFDVTGESELAHCIQDIDLSNTVDGRPIYYWVNRQNMVVPSDAGYVALVNSSNITVAGFDLRNNGAGIMLIHANNIRITENNLTDNHSGVKLYWSSDNIVSQNNITDSANNVVLRSSSNNIVSENHIEGGISGIYFGLSSSNNTVSENSITNSFKGVEFEGSGSSNNRFYHNNFIANNQQVYISMSGYANFWDDGYPSGGNYWSDYTGVDANGDGIGDTPYILDAPNVDNYPLMQPFTKIQIPGDINHDGVVNIVDIVIVALEFGHPPPPIVDLRADVNKDGLVNIVDIVIVALHFGETG